MTMWDHLTPRNLIDAQRAAALQEMGERARVLFAEGYSVDGDRVLDEMAERKAAWDRESS